MKILCKGLGRHYNFRWVFRHLDFEFSAGTAYAVIGPNGSGKSTLAQLVASSLSPSEGSIDYHLNGAILKDDRIYRYLGIAAPYIEMIEEFSVRELIKFHTRFKHLIDGVDTDDMIEHMGLSEFYDHPVNQLSSGMKQRIRLFLAMCTQVPLVLLDEPFTNLDKEGISWFTELAGRYKKDRLLIICSNRREEYEPFCEEVLDLSGFGIGNSPTHER